MNLTSLPDITRGAVINDFLASIHIFSSAVNELIERQLEQELGEKLSFSQLKVLLLVARTNAGTVSNVAAFLGVTNPAASKAVDRLVKRNLIKRTESSDDRRSLELSLTKEGQALLESYASTQKKILETLFPQVNLQNLAQATDILDHLSADLSARDHAPEEICYRCGIFFRHQCLRRSTMECSCSPHPFGPAPAALSSALTSGKE